MGLSHPPGLPGVGWHADCGSPGKSAGWRELPCRIKRALTAGSRSATIRRWWSVTARRSAVTTARRSRPDRRPRPPWEHARTATVRSSIRPPGLSGTARCSAAPTARRRCRPEPATASTEIAACSHVGAGRRVPPRLGHPGRPYRDVPFVACSVGAPRCPEDPDPQVRRIIWNGITPIGVWSWPLMYAPLDTSSSTSRPRTPYELAKSSTAWRSMTRPRPW